MKETANRYTTALLGVIAVLALAAFSAPASAECDCVTIDNGTINGSIYYKTYDAWPGTASGGGYTASHTFTGVPAGVKTARVHAGVWMLDPGYVDITVNGNASDTQYASDCNCSSINTTKMHSYCTGYGVHFITYNATADVVGGGDIPVTVASTNAGDGRIYTIALLVVYENDTMANMTYWINEGAWYTGDGQAVVNFNGPYPSGVTDVTYWTLGMPYGISTNPLLNTNDIGTPDYSESGYYDFWRWDNIDTDNLTAPNNQMVHPVSGGDWQRLDAAVLRLWRSPSDLPDLIVTDIDFPDVMKPDTNYTVNATIKNQGKDAVASTATLYVDDVWNGSASVPTLNAGVSATVSFTPQVNLAAGCYDFRVVADSAGVIGESDETNNASNEDYQVGNAIVVRSNADLITEADRNVSGTYYIENRTITNCTGNGITIENTTVPFVIDNCTVQNCGDSGIYLYNLTNGKVNGSEVNGNTLSGIEVQKGSTYVELTNNTVEGNTMYGIEVGLVTLSGDEIPKFINISCNKLYQNLYGIEMIGNESIVKYNNASYNGKYGIYVFGNDNRIYSNTIENNAKYGVKLYNSTGNYVYCNNFTDNNASNSGHQACDNRNTNYWNNATTGNNWSDWQSNPGYPYYNYSIDCGNNKDDMPNGIRIITLQVYNAKLYDIGDSGRDVTSDVNTSNDIYAEVEVRRSDYQIGNATLNFTASIPGTINLVMFNYEHREDTALTDMWIEVLDANGTWVYYSADESGSDSNNSCNITGTIDTTDEANSTSIRYVCSRTGGNPNAIYRGYLDCANLTITYTP